MAMQSTALITISGISQASSKTATDPRHPKISPPDDPLRSSHGKSPLRIPSSIASPSKKPRRNFKICQCVGLTLFPKEGDILMVF
jgi:hypothetical protein